MKRFILTVGLAAIVAVVTVERGFADEHGQHGLSVPSGERPLAVLKRFPVDPESYCPEAADLLRKGILEKYGLEEWAAVVLTHELHQHVGIYTVLGAKMGVRAREVLNAPTRAVHVTPETQKLIEVPKVPTPRVAAVFRYEDRAIRLSLRPEYRKMVQENIKSAIDNHGNLTPAYFHEIEDRCFDVWAEFDRREIFLEERLHADPQTERE